ncbi:hypothetical protein [Nonomuraea glycinis]|jgi:hypothetical protein
MMSIRREQETEQGEAATKAPPAEEETSPHPGGPGKFDTAADYEFKRLKELNPDDFE